MAGLCAPRSGSLRLKGERPASDEQAETGEFAVHSIPAGQIIPVGYCCHRPAGYLVPGGLHVLCSVSGAQSTRYLVPKGLCGMSGISGAQGTRYLVPEGLCVLWGVSGAPKPWVCGVKSGAACGHKPPASGRAHPSEPWGMDVGLERGLQAPLHPRPGAVCELPSGSLGSEKGGFWMIPSQSTGVLGNESCC